MYAAIRKRDALGSIAGFTLFALLLFPAIPGPEMKRIHRFRLWVGWTMAGLFVLFFWGVFLHPYHAYRILAPVYRFYQGHTLVLTVTWIAVLGRLFARHRRAFACLEWTDLPPPLKMGGGFQGGTS